MKFFNADDFEAVDLDDDIDGCKMTYVPSLVNRHALASHVNRIMEDRRFLTDTSLVQIIDDAHLLLSRAKKLMGER